MQRVYLDHNATSPLRDEVRDFYVECLETVRGNPSSLHGPGRAARQVLDEARERVAAALGVSMDEVLFTSGGTESDRLALFGALEARPNSGLVTTEIEHSAVLEAARELEAQGRRVAWAKVNAEGFPAAEDIASLASEVEAGLVSVMAVNNELGTAPPLGDIALALASSPASERPLFHTDAVQALGRVPVDLCAWGVDLASFSVHKIGGPLGVGLLYVKSGTALGSPDVARGSQELGLRPGTENVPGIAAAALSVELAVNEREAFHTRSQQLTHKLWKDLHEAFPDVRLLGPALDDPHRSPQTLNVLFPGVDGRVLVTRLDLAGLEASAGSACASGSLEASHVLRALGLSDEDARSGLRLSLGRTTTEQDVHIAVDILRRTFFASR